MAGRIWVDGVEGAGLPGDDPGFTRGWNAFETFRTYGSVPFRLTEHLDRLDASCGQMELPPQRAEVEAEIRSFLFDDAVYRVTLTGGGRRVLHIFGVDASRIGAPVTSAMFPFSPAGSLPGTVKHGSRAAWMLAARQLGVTEVLFVDDGRILEANRSNVFAVIGGELWTPPLDGRQLAGITRQAMIEAADQAGLSLREEPLVSDAPFEELYLSSTLKELAPVVLLNGQPGPGAGPVGAALLRAFRVLVAKETGNIFSGALFRDVDASQF